MSALDRLFGWVSRRTGDGSLLHEVEDVPVGQSTDVSLWTVNSREFRMPERSREYAYPYPHLVLNNKAMYPELSQWASDNGIDYDEWYQAHTLSYTDWLDATPEQIRIELLREAVSDGIRAQLPKGMN